MLAVAVEVVVDGHAVAASQPAVLVAGTVVAPVDPYLRRIATTIVVDPDRGTIAFARGDASGVVRLGHSAARMGSVPVALPIAPFLRDGQPVIPLAALARALGAAVTFDARSKTLSVVLPNPKPIATLPPYVPIPGAPPPSPFRVDTRASPHPAATWTPQPRRTPISTAPSEPLSTATP
jgi:hypothetical protein